MALTAATLVVCELGEAAALVRFVDGQPPLPDAGFRVVPPRCWSVRVLGLHTLAPSLGVVLALLLGLGFAALGLRGRARAGALRKAVCAADALLLLCAACVAGTQLVNPNPACARCGDGPAGCSETFAAALALVLRDFPWLSCGDLMFSEHTCFLLLAAALPAAYGTSRASRALAAALAALAAATVVGLVSCRMHYTDDIVLAVALTAMVWALLHPDRAWARCLGERLEPAARPAADSLAGAAKRPLLAS